MADLNKGFCYKLTNLFRLVDYFNVTFMFRVNKKPAYASSTGGFWFFLFLLFAVAFLIKSIFDFLGGNQITVIFIDKSASPSPKLNITQYKFNYAFRITYDNDSNLNGTIYEDLFNYDSNYVKVNSKGKQKKTMSTRPCRASDFASTQQDSLFSIVPFENFTCLENPEEISLFGIYTDKEMAYYEILTRINPKYFSNYSNLEQIFLNNQFKMTFYYTDTLNDVSSQDNAVFFHMNAIYTYIDLQFFKRENINFQEFIYSEDKNLLYENYRNQSYVKLESSQDISVSMLNRNVSNLSDNMNLVKYFLRAVNNQKIVKRSYQKIPQFLAGLSGLLVNMLVGIGIAMTTLNRFKAKQSVMDKILKYKDNIKEKNQETLNYLTTKFSDKKYFSNVPVSKAQPKPNQVSHVEMENNLIEKLTDNENDLNNDSIFESVKSSMNRTTRNTTRSKNPLLITCSDVCCLLFCCKSIKIKKKIYDNAEKKFNYYLDLITYMKKMQEIDILKYVLLDEDLLNLMNFISKPSVSLSKDTIDNHEYNKFFNEEDGIVMNCDNIDILKRSYVRILSKPEMTRIDNRVLELFDMQIKDIQS